MSSVTAQQGQRELGAREFDGFRRMIFESAGITLADAKRPLVNGRLSKRVAELDLDGFAAYLALVRSDARERQIAIDLLTTNETYFFREPRHFEYLAEHIAPALREVSAPTVWCAASSTGEEPYTIAMVLAQALGHLRFEILASDISTRVLHTARRALYPMEDAASIASPYRRRYCLKGVGSQQGWFTIDPALAARVRYAQINLNETLPEIGSFDLIFVRNVMIYFSQPTRQAVMRRIVPRLKPAGHLFISHSETLHGVTEELSAVRPSIYVHRACA